MIIKFITPLIMLLFFISCANTAAKLDPKRLDRTNPLYQLGNDLAKKLDIKLQYSDIDHQGTLDEITLILNKNELRAIINGHIFKRNEAKPVESTKHIIEDLASVINNYPKLDIRVYGHSENLGSQKEKQDLSDNRAIAVAEILYKLDNKNDTFAKGCSDRKPIFAPDSDEHIISNGRVEIYFYTDKKYAKDKCK